MTDGPYRDLGAGFARLTGSEAPRRAPSGISRVEDALVELLRNARDADAANVYVASTLRDRRFRSLIVIDDGCGVPESHVREIFAPGVTTRHLAPIRARNDDSPHGAGLALHHIKDAAVSAELLHANSPTVISVTFDTRKIPERSLQSGSRTSQSNLLATLKLFVKDNPTPNLFYASPAGILATLLENHIIRNAEPVRILLRAKELGLCVSSKTVARILSGEISPAGRIAAGESRETQLRRPSIRSKSEGPSLSLGDADCASIREIFTRAARASYLEAGEVKFTSRPGEFSVVVRVYESEDEYG